MTRLLRLTALLAGHSLLLLTLGGLVLRPTTNTDWVPIVAQTRPTDGHVRLVQVWPGVPTPLPLMDDFAIDVHFKGVFAEGTTITYAALAEDYTLEDYDQSDVETPRGRRIFHQGIYGSAVASPDGAWVLYMQNDPTLTLPFWAIHLPTGRKWHISAIVQPSEVEVYGGHRFSDDGRWLYVVVNEPAAIQTYALWRIDLSNGTGQRMPAGIQSPDFLRVVGQTGDWMILLHGRTLSRLRIDQYAIEPLLDTDWMQTDPETVETLPDLSVNPPIAVVGRGGRLIGVNVETLAVVWEYTEVGFGLDPANPDGWRLATRYHLPVRLNILTGEVQSLPAPLDPTQTFMMTQTRDSQWLIYGSLAMDGLAWWRVNWATGESQRIRRAIHDNYFVGLAPDGQWILVNREDGLYRMSVRSGVLELLLPDRPYSLAGWMHPYVQSWHPLPLLLIALALMLIGILPCHRLKSLLHRLSTSGGH